MSDPTLRWRDYLAPRYWPTWVGIAILWLWSRLPFMAQMTLGKLLGKLAWYLLPDRRKITRINLTLAFPEKSNAEITALAKTVYLHVGMSIAEGASLWFRPLDFYQHRFKLQGIEHVQQALAEGHGVILLQAHFTLLEMNAAALGPRFPISAVFDPPKNALFAEFLVNRRQRFLTDLIDNREIRQMVRRLKRGEMVWYSPDQSVGKHHGGIATRFFDQPVLTTAGTRRIVRMTGATVLPLIPTRHPGNGTYTLTIGTPISIEGDDEQATQIINNMFEEQIRQQPEQYFWMHKRFKPPTPEFSNPYKF